MAQAIIYKNKFGNVTVCHPGYGYSIEYVMQNDIPKNPDLATDSVFHVVESDSLPWKDSDFFDAWRLSGEIVTIDFDVAKEIIKERLRYDRVPLLAAQDVLFQRALETGADTSSIIAEKQRLRDITMLADNCMTLDELRALRC